MAGATPRHERSARRRDFMSQIYRQVRQAPLPRPIVSAEATINVQGPRH
jgi:hypothetical protein